MYKPKYYKYGYGDSSYTTHTANYYLNHSHNKDDEYGDGNYYDGDGGDSGGDSRCGSSCGSSCESGCGSGCGAS